MRPIWPSVIRCSAGLHLTAFGTGEYDASGSRIVPAFPDPAGDSCAALFGDSFTWGDEVHA